jgi:hypothetical protein
MRFLAPDAAWDLSSWGIGRFEGAATIRTFHEDRIGSCGSMRTSRRSRTFGSDVSFVGLG